MKQTIKTQLIAGIITVIVLGLLLLVGPAEGQCSNIMGAENKCGIMSNALGYGYNYGYGYSYEEDYKEYEWKNITFVSGNITQINNTNLGISLNINANGKGNINIKKYATNPESGFGILSLSKFFEIDADNSINLNETIIKISYTDAEVNALDIDENTLRLYYFNSTSNTWVIYNGLNGGVNISGNYVWAKTNHFSLWGIFGNSIPSSPSVSVSSSGGNGGGGLCYRGYKTGNWSECINNTQTREIIIDLTKCYQDIANEPLKIQSCEIVTETPIIIPEKPAEKKLLFVDIARLIKKIWEWWWRLWK